MSELTLTVLRLGFLVLLWVFVIGIVGVLRRDLFGSRVVPRGAPGRGGQGAPRQAKPAKPAKPARGERGVPRSLVVTAGSLKGTTIALGQSPVLIGRSPECTLVLTDDYSSGRHARLFPQQGRWMVEDLGSTNGTFIGRDQLTAPRAVEPGTQLRIGRTVLELRK